MKKKQKRARKLRKCELGVKTRKFNHGAYHYMGVDGAWYARSKLWRMFSV